ncbi:MAG: hypothetical protein INR65_04910 [Gluconacetobacter diazotrophicus]|nr:hypothetical protein [Gluconacetobacter diazotrophicus]
MFMLFGSAVRNASARWRPGVAALLLGLGACTASDPSRRPVEIGADPSSLIDTYLFVRGVALGYSHSGRAGPAEVSRLVGYDHAALLAVIVAQEQPTDANRIRAEQALRSMLAYAGTEDLRGVPAPDSPLAAVLRARSVLAPFPP